MAAAAFLCALCEVRAGQASEAEQIQQLRKQNEALQEELKRQRTAIESLTRQVEAIEKAKGEAAPDTVEAEGSRSGSKLLEIPGKVILSGEGGVGLFHTGSEGAFSDTPFRVDEARLFFEAPIWDDVYFFTELNLRTRESDDFRVELGELYVDFENVSKLWGREGMLNVRAGQMYTPFGEEYLNRYAINNPLISHSLSDLWAVDDGIELYGRIGKFSYAVAVQNGGVNVADFDSDKSVAGRLSFDPAQWLHLSISGMRTGELDANGDQLSAMWFGNGYFRSSDSGGVTKFHANLVEGDVIVNWRGGHLGAFGGYIRYDDNAPTTSNRRDVYYYSVEGVQNVVGKLYAAARFSQILAEGGFPIVGHGEFGEFFFNTLTEEIWRLSLGLGYRFSQNLIVKGEYTFERGKTLGGGERNDEDFAGVEAAFKF